MITGTSRADDFFNPPPLNPELPPWMQDSAAPAQPAQPGGQPAQAAPEATVPAPDFSTPDSSSGSDEEEGSPFDFEGGGGGGGGGKGSDQGKQNFQILDKVDRSKSSGSDCVGWGTSFLGTRVFTSESMCRNELDQQLENARDRINNYADFTEKEVLRGVIKGKISREKSKDFHLQFSSLKDAITLAGKTGCKCLE